MISFLAVRKYSSSRKKQSVSPQSRAQLKHKLRPKMCYLISAWSGCLFLEFKYPFSLKRHYGIGMNALFLRHLQQLDFLGGCCLWKKNYPNKLAFYNWYCRIGNFSKNSKIQTHWIIFLWGDLNVSSYQMKEGPSLAGLSAFNNWKI